MRLKLHHQIVIAMLLGAGIGLPLNILAAEGRLSPSWPQAAAAYGKGAGDLFLRLLSMVVAPLIFTSLVTGVMGTRTLRGLRRIGLRTLVFYITTTLIAITTGMLLFHVIEPGQGVNLEALLSTASEQPLTLPIQEQGIGETLWQQVFKLVPANPFAALADPANQSVLGVIFFALLFGAFTNAVGGETANKLSHGFQAAFEVMMRMTLFIVRLAPLGVLGFMLYASAAAGIAVFRALGWYALTVAGGLTVHAFITLPLLLVLLARRSPLDYARALSPALITAFSTASSNGTLPLTMTCVERRAGLSSRISAFVLPLGATINMDGTALYEAVAVLFIAQVTGHDLTFAQQVIVALAALLASIGAAGIPHAGTVMLVVVLSAVHLPVEYIGLILAVDRVLDMYRTSVNVWSDATCCAVVARWEGDAADAGQSPSPGAGRG